MIANRGSDTMHTLQQQIQRDAYTYPYHYIPQFRPQMRLSCQWNFAPSYLAAINLVSAWLREMLENYTEQTQWRHLDIGCGDGALIHHLKHSSEFDTAVLFEGVDTDSNAIAWAKMFNPEISFHEVDLNVLPEGMYDSATLIEVAEHIPPAQLASFMGACAKRLRLGGQMFVTVPSVEKRLESKHHQHFCISKLRLLFAEEFEIIYIGGFERYDAISRLVAYAAYRSAIRVEFGPATRLLIKKLQKKFAKGRGCGRLLAVVRRKEES